jgi:Asp-tRNA(Asn)/Glu-tRNA(Gln) amidotransferase A subunit family amidase
MQRREFARSQIDAALEQVDVVITPTTAVYPPLRGQEMVKVSAGRSMSVREAVLGQTMAFSLFGLPTLSLPVSQTKAARGFPLGLQVFASRGADERVLACSQTLERMFS